jgi:hypothetical protein
LSQTTTILEIQDIFGGFGGSSSLVTLTHIQNSPPVLHAPSLVGTTEDLKLSVGGVSVTDQDTPNAPAETIAVSLLASHGLISFKDSEAASRLVFPTGDGDSDQLVTVVGTQEDINLALASLEYISDLHWSGDDLVTILANDQGTFGIGPVLRDQRVIQVSVRPSNDRPSVVLPAFQSVHEDNVLAMYGISVDDVDHSVAPDSLVQCTLFVLAGTLSLSVTDGLQFFQGDGHDDMLITFAGTLVDVNAALTYVEYKGHTNSNDNHAPESLTVFITDLGYTGSSSDTALDDIQVVPISVMPVNDAPSVVLPRFVKVDVQGFVVADTDANSTEVVSVKLNVMSGQATIALASSTGLVFDDDVSEGSLKFEGSLEDVNKALDVITYERSKGKVLAFYLLNSLSPFHQVFAFGICQ